MTQRTANSIVHDQRGAVLLMGVFFVVFLVGAAYYVIGIAEAVVHKQRMQDAADAGAFAAAVMHARGMNMICLINITMSALLSVLVLLRMMEGLLTIAIAALAVAAFFSAGSTSSLIPPLTRARSMVQQVQGRAKPVIHNALAALHAAGKGVRVLMPWAAQARVVDTVRAEYGDVASLGFALPMSLTLPVTPDDWDVLCGKAGEVAADLALLPVQGIVPSMVEERVGDAARSLTESLSAYFCGGTNQPPRYEPPEDNIVLPKLESRARCERNQDPNAGSALCREAALDEAQGAPGEDGECNSGPITIAAPLGGMDANQTPSREAIGADCEKHAAWVLAAAQQCDPHSADNPHRDDLESFVWQEARRTFDFSYVTNSAGGTWQRTPLPGGVREFDQLRRVVGDGDDQPRYCERREQWQDLRNEGGFCESPQSEWQFDCTAVIWSDPNALNQCPSGRLPALPLSGVQAGSRIRIQAPVTRKVLGCQTPLRVEVTTLDMEQNGGVQNKDNKRPFKLEDSALLGEDVFQLRVVVLGKAVSEAGARGVRAALREAPDGRSSFLSALRQAGRVAVAQAEYFTTEADGESQSETAERRSWMWSPKWRARLRRIWIPSEFSSARSSADDPDLGNVRNQRKSLTVDDACRNATGSDGTSVDSSGCGENLGPGGGSGLTRLLETLSEVFIH